MSYSIRWVGLVKPGLNILNEFLNYYWKSYPLEKALIQLTYYLTQGSKLIESDLGTILRHPLVALRLDVTMVTSDL